MDKKTVLITGSDLSGRCAEVIALAREKGVEVQIVDIDDLPDNIKDIQLDLQECEFMPFKVDPDYFFKSEVKIDQFQNRNLGEKVGGRKHKKNPFKYNR